MAEHESRPVEWLVGKKGGALFDANVRIRIEDEAAGEFVRIDSLSENNQVSIDPDEWPTVRAAIDHAFSLCRGGTESDGDE